MGKTFTIALISVSGVAWSQEQVDSIQTHLNVLTKI